MFHSFCRKMAEKEAKKNICSWRGNLKAKFPLPVLLCSSFTNNHALQIRII